MQIHRYCLEHKYKSIMYCKKIKCIISIKISVKWNTNLFSAAPHAIDRQIQLGKHANKPTCLS